MHIHIYVCMYVYMGLYAFPWRMITTRWRYLCVYMRMALCTHMWNFKENRNYLVKTAVCRICVCTHDVLMHVYMYVCVCVYTDDVSMHVYVSIHMCVYTHHVPMHVYMYVYIYIYIHTYIHTHAYTIHTHIPTFAHIWREDCECQAKITFQNLLASQHW